MRRPEVSGSLVYLSIKHNAFKWGITPKYPPLFPLIPSAPGIRRENIGSFIEQVRVDPGHNIRYVMHLFPTHERQKSVLGNNTWFVDTTQHVCKSQILNDGPFLECTSTRQLVIHNLLILVEAHNGGVFSFGITSLIWVGRSSRGITTIITVHWVIITK